MGDQLSGQVSQVHLRPRRPFSSGVLLAQLWGGWALRPFFIHWPCVFPGPSHPLVACSALCVCLLFTCYTPFQAPRESFLSYWPHHANIWVNIVSVAFLIQGKKLKPLAQFMSPILSYMPTRKPHSSLFPTPVTWVLMDHVSSLSWSFVVDSFSFHDYPPSTASSLTVTLKPCCPEKFPWFVPKPGAFCAPKPLQASPGSICKA